jgi:hypothetical protein
MVKKLIFPLNQNATLTAGLICAPLILPTGETVTRQPIVPNINPVMTVLKIGDGNRFAMTEPSPQLKMTIESPKRSSAATPMASDKKSFQLDFAIFMKKSGIHSGIMCKGFGKQF